MVSVRFKRGQNAHIVEEALVLLSTELVLVRDGVERGERAFVVKPDVHWRAKRLLVGHFFVDETRSQPVSD